MRYLKHLQDDLNYCVECEVCLRPSPVAARIFVLASLAIFFNFNFRVGNDLTLVQRYAETAFPPWYAWIYTMGLWSVAHMVNRRFLPPHHQHLLWAGLGIWLVALNLARTPFQSAEDAGWLVVMAAVAAMLLIGSHQLCLPHRGFFWLCWIGSVYSATFLWHTHGQAPLDLSTLGTKYAFGLGMISILLVMFADGHHGVPKFWHRLWQAALSASILLPMIAFLARGQTAVKGIALLENILLAGIGFGFIGYGSEAGRPAMINGGCAIIFLLIVTRFIDVFGSFLRSGIGMVAAGLILAGVAFALNRGRETLVHASEKDRNHP